MVISQARLSAQQNEEVLAEKAPNNRKSLDATVYQEIYNFWLSESINSNDGRTNVVNISKSLFIQQYKFIKDENLMEKEVKLKHCTKRILYTGRKIYIESLRNLHERFNTTQNENVSLSVFYSYKPYYCSTPTEKEKTSCLCIDCLNPHLLPKPINNYRKSRNLNAYQSLSMYLNENKNDDDLFPETKEENQLYYYVYERKIEYYKGKDDKDVQYTRTARVDKKDKVSAIVGKLVQISQRYLKHRSYVDNLSRVLPMIKDGFSGKYIELDFSENLALRPKHEVQSAHFSGKQHTLHCAIFQPGETKFHYHISDDTKHDPVFADEVLRDLIHHYDIRNEDIMIQSENAPTQYKSRHAFALLQKLANEFNVRIIRTHGAAEHGKGTIDAMSSFGVKSVLRRDIATHDIFFDTSEEIVDYLQIKNPQFCYAHIDAKYLSRKRRDYMEHVEPTEIAGCMKQHMFVYTPNSKENMCKEYLCDCSQCLQLNINNCCCSFQSGEMETLHLEEEFVDSSNTENYGQHIFEFIDIPWYIGGRTMEPLYFVLVKEKGVAGEVMKDCYDRVMSAGDMFFRGNYLKLTRSQNPNFKQFQIIQREVLLSPDEVNDTYVDINDDLYMNVNIYNGLITKAQF